MPKYGTDLEQKLQSLRLATQSILASARVTTVHYVNLGSGVINAIHYRFAASLPTALGRL